MDLSKQLQWNLTNMINMDHIKTYAAVLSTVELSTRLKQDREKWRAMFHTCIKLFPPTPVDELYILYKWLLVINNTQSSQISQKQHRRNIYVVMKTMCPPGYHYDGFLAAHALGHMMNNVPTVHHVPKCIICHRVIVVTARAHWFHDCMNLFMYICIYIYIYIYIYNII